MAEEQQELDTVVEDIVEDNGQGVDFASVNTTPASKPQSQTPKKAGESADEANAVKLSAEPSIEADAKAKSSDEVTDKQEVVAPVKQLKYKPKDANRIPQARFNQVVRQRKIEESKARALQQEHLELLNYLEQFQAKNPSIPLPEELTSRISAKKAELQEARTKQHEARLDEADEWLKSELKKYTDNGFTFPSSFEKEMIAIVQAEGLNSLDPVEAYTKALKIWVDENVDSIEEELSKTDTSNPSGKPENKSSVEPAKAREEQKKKAAGVPKTKATTPTPTKDDRTTKWEGYQTVSFDANDNPRW